ncbi:hypothetical protein ABE042_04730 [Viridibacillus arvi]|uniref:hypothetical protein n=1 Tax=Viridibacillus arvi TaxID=263475 RepID=UPI003D2DAB32
MPTNTPNYNLIKPDPLEFYDVEVQNANMDRIDGKIKELQDELNKGSGTDPLLTSHLSDPTPHIFTDATDKKTYEYGFKTNAAKDGLIFVYNEVTV